eukprot:6135235-Amphidinium_carterae.8
MADDSNIEMEASTPRLTAITLHDIGPVQGDTEEQRRQLQEMADIKDDKNSTQDNELDRQEAEESHEDHHARLARMTAADDMEEQGRLAEARERHRCRKVREREGNRPRHKGTAEQLHIQYQAMHQRVFTARGHRLAVQA